MILNFLTKNKDHIFFLCGLIIHSCGHWDCYSQDANKPWTARNIAMQCSFNVPYCFHISLCHYIEKGYIRKPKFLKYRQKLQTVSILISVFQEIVNLNTNISPSSGMLQGCCNKSRWLRTRTQVKFTRRPLIIEAIGPNTGSMYILWLYIINKIRWRKYSYTFEINVQDNHIWSFSIRSAR